MNELKDYECEGQLSITDYFKSQIELRKVMDLTEWINTRGKCQFDQIGDIIAKYIEDEDLRYDLTNAVSVYVLEQSLGYMAYLKMETGVKPE